MPPIRRRPTAIVHQPHPIVIRRPSLPPTVIRRPPTAIVHQPTASSPPTAIVHQPSPSTPPTSMGSMVKSGFSWGLGNGIANALVGSVFNKISTDPSVAPTSVEYVQCMKDFDDKEACKHLLK